MLLPSPLVPLVPVTVQQVVQATEEPETDGQGDHGPYDEYDPQKRVHAASFRRVPHFGRPRSASFLNIIFLPIVLGGQPQGPPAFHGQQALLELTLQLGQLHLSRQAAGMPFFLNL